MPCTTPSTLSLRSHPYDAAALTDLSLGFEVPPSDYSVLPFDVGCRRFHSNRKQHRCRSWADTGPPATRFESCTTWPGTQSSKILSGFVQDPAIDSQGRIVIASNVGDELFQQTRIVRLLANGEVDGTFGANVVIPNFQNQNGVFAELVTRDITIDLTIGF